MSRTYLEKLRKVSPGFREDRDEDWLVYLPKEDVIQVRKWRASFQQQSEKLDDVRLEQDEVQDKILTDELNKFINNLLIHLPRLKEKATKKRDEEIRDDFSNSSKRPKYDGSLTGDLNLVPEYLPFEFLPSNMTRKESAPPEPKKAQASQGSSKQREKTPPRESKSKKQQKTTEPPRDTYLDGVTDESYKRVLKALRPYVERYQCKGRLIEALDSMKRHEDTVDIFNTIMTVVKTYNKTNSV